MVVPTALREAGVTPREAEVLDALALRLTNAEIAERLWISIRTVESHVSALLRKLGEPDRLRLAARARGLFEPGSLPLPVVLADALEGAPFVGRAGELTRLRSLGELAGRAGVRRGVLVTGEAGIGKTRLAAEAASLLHAAGAVVIHGRCQQETLIPYQPFLEAAQTLSGVPRRLGEGMRDPGDDPASARYRLFEEFDHLVASRPALVVIVLDDVQWLDPSGVRLLHHLLHRVGRSPLLLVATGRPEAMEPKHPLTAALAAAQSAGVLEVISLPGLSLDEAASLADVISTADSQRAREAWERTGGNPFLLAELLRHDAPDQLPRSARDAIVRRVAGLGPAVFEVLSAAAVVGEVFHLGLLSAALVGNDEMPAASLERAFGAGLVVEDPNRRGEYRFAHAIVREALLAVVSPSRRTQLHLRLATALDAGGPAASPEVARHRNAALPDGDPSLALRSAVDAYDHAISQLAYEVAASFADLALDAVDAGGEDERARADATLRRGRAVTMAGDLERGASDCRKALELAARHGFNQLRAEAVLGWAESSPVWGRNPDLRAALELVLAKGVADVDLRARLKARLAQALYYEDAHDLRFRLAREAVADARLSGRPDTLAAVLATTHAALSEPAQLDQRTEVARQIVTTAATSGHPELEAHGLGWLTVDLLEAGDLRGADDALVRHAALARRLGQRLMLRDVELWAAMRATVDGRFGEAAERIERGRDLGEAARDPSTESIYWVQRYWLAVERGSPPEMDAVVEPCELLAKQNTDVPAWRASVAFLHIRRGDHAAARRQYEPLAADGFQSIPNDVVWLNAMTYLAETCAALDDADRALLLLDILKPYEDRLALIDRALACKGSVHRFLGLLAATTGDLDRADRHLSRALERHQAMQAGPLADRTRKDLVRLGR